MRKIFALFLCLFVLNLAYADDTNTTPTISWVSYDWYLSNSTVVNINWSNLSLCKDLKIWWTSVSITSKTDSLLTYNFSESLKYNWSLTVDCNWTGLNYLISFPYIKSITWFKDSKFDRNITISWLNFTSSPNVSLTWGSTFSTITAGDTSIYWTLDENLKWNELSVNVWWLNSNIYSMSQKIPYITHIVWLEWFNVWSTVSIYWKNLNSYNDYKVKYWDNYLDVSSYNASNWSVSFKIPDWLGKFNVWVYSNWIVSNYLALNVTSWKPLITKVLEENLQNTDWTSTKVLAVYWQNFATADVTKVYINWSEAQISSFVSQWLIYLSNYTLNPWNNYVEVLTNWNKSWVFNLQTSTSKLPELWGYEVTKTESTSKTISIYVSNFNSTTDEIYLNDTLLTVSWINSNTVTVWVDSSLLSWIFKIKRWSYISPKVLTYDVTYESTPYINTITFAKTPSKSVRYEITWWNFLNASFSQSNFSILDANWSPDFSVSDSKIIWYLPADYDVNSSSSLSISKNWLDTSVSFVWKDLWTNLVVYWQPLVNKFISSSSDWMFRPWDKVQIVSKNLHSWDVVNIWDKKIWTVYMWTASYSYFTIPELSDYKEYDVTITNTFGVTSKTNKLLIVDKDYTPSVNVFNNTIDKKTYYTDNTDILSYPIYSLKISNKIKDLYLKKITFKIPWYTWGLNYWTYYLKLNDTVVWTTQIPSSDWTFTFEYLSLPVSNTDYILSLYKSSVYTQKTSYKVTVDSSSISFVDPDFYAYSSIELPDFLTNTINVSQTSSVACLDSESSNFYCNTYYNQNWNAWVSTVDTSTQTWSYAENNNLTNTDNSSSTDLSQDNSWVIYTQINIVTYKFKSSSYTKLNNQFIAFAKQAVNNEKYVTKLKDLETTINNILKSLYFYENSTKKLEKSLYVKKLKNDIVKFKQLIK